MTIRYKEINIHYNTVGKGNVLVFLHGFLENSKMWEATTKSLSKMYTCITIDLLGHGETPCLGYIHTMEDMAMTVKAVLDYLNIERATMIGHSMGGYVALAYVDLFGDSASGIVLLNSTALPDSKERYENRNRAIKVVKDNPNAFTSMAIANLFSIEHRTIFTEEIKRIRAEALKTPLQGIISALEGMKVRKDRTHILKNFKQPKIIFSGSKDPILLQEKTVKESQLCNTPLISFDGGHMTYIENEKKYIEELHKFVTNIF